MQQADIAAAQYTFSSSCSGVKIIYNYGLRDEIVHRGIYILHFFLSKIIVIYLCISAKLLCFSLHPPVPAIELLILV